MPARGKKTADTIFTEQPIFIKKTKEELHEKNFIIGCLNDADHDDDFLPEA